MKIFLYHALSLEYGSSEFWNDNVEEPKILILSKRHPCYSAFAEFKNVHVTILSQTVGTMIEAYSVWQVLFSTGNS